MSLKDGLVGVKVSSVDGMVGWWPGGLVGFGKLVEFQPVS